MKILLIDSMPMRIKTIFDDQRSEVQNTVNADGSISKNLRSKMMVGFNEATDGNMVRMEQGISSYLRLYTLIAELNRFLESGSGSPKLTSKGELLFANQKSIDIFNLYAEKINMERQSLISAVEASQKFQKERGERLKNAVEK